MPARPAKDEARRDEKPAPAAKSWAGRRGGGPRVGARDILSGKPVNSSRVGGKTVADSSCERERSTIWWRVDHTEGRARPRRPERP